MLVDCEGIESCEMVVIGNVEYDGDDVMRSGKVVETKYMEIRL